MGSSIKKDIPIIEQGLTIPEVCVEDAAPRQYNSKFIHLHILSLIIHALP